MKSMKASASWWSASGSSPEPADNSLSLGLGGKWVMGTPLWRSRVTNTNVSVVVFLWCTKCVYANVTVLISILFHRLWFRLHAGNDIPWKCATWNHRKGYQIQVENASKLSNKGCLPSPKLECLIPSSLLSGSGIDHFGHRPHGQPDNMMHLLSQWIPSGKVWLMDATWCYPPTTSKLIVFSFQYVPYRPLISVKIPHGRKIGPLLIWNDARTAWLGGFEAYKARWIGHKSIQISGVGVGSNELEAVTKFPTGLYGFKSGSTIWYIPSMLQA